MRHHRVVAALLLASSVLPPALAAAPVAADGGTRVVSRGGTAQLVERPAGPDTGVADPELRREPDAAREGAQGAEIQFRNTQPAGNAAATAAAANASAAAELFRRQSRVRDSFNGLNLRDQRTANGGNQFTVEPPDQGLCIGNDFVLESVNDVLRVYNTDGDAVTAVIDLNTFYGYPAQFVRPVGPLGPFVTDPSCWYDAQTQRFFHVVLTLDVFPDTGDFTGVNHLDLAVSQTNDPTEGWFIYRLDVTDDGTNGTPNHHCPPAAKPPAEGHRAPTHPNACIGDFPHIGADKFGIYLTTNEYCLFCPATEANPAGFHGAQVYAFDKLALANGAATMQVTQVDTAGMQAGKPGFTLWPATSPTAGDFETGAAGTEYFTSSNAAEEATNVPNRLGTNRSNEIIVWALTNTSSLRTASPNVHLRNTSVRVSEYTVPPLSNQKPGPFPLGQCVNDTTMPTPFGPGCWQMILVDEPAHDEVEGPLDSSDSRVLSTTFADNLLWGTLDTGVSVGGKTKAGVLWYVIRPTVLDNSILAFALREGQIAAANNNAIYGAVAATHTGRGAIGFTLVGDNHYPSAAYVTLDPIRGAGPINVIAEGVGPQDGFSEYKAFADDPEHPRPRWGDYGAAVATGGSTIWVANEWIARSCTLQEYYPHPSTVLETAVSGFGSCGGTRVSLGNWATRITRIQVTP